MLRQIIAVLLLVASSSTVLWSMGTFMGEESQPEPPRVMYQYLARVLELQPYLASADRWSDAKNRATIQQDLAALADRSKQLTEIHRLQSGAFQPNASLLIDDIHTSLRAYETGSYEFSRKMMKSSLRACANCHAQVGQEKGPRWQFDEASLRGSAFERAEFLMATRQYDEAEATFRGIAEGTSSTENSSEVGTSVQRVLQIDLEVKRDLDAAEMSLSRISQNQKLPDDTKTKVKLWQQQLKSMQAKPIIEPKKSSAEDMIRYTKSFVGDLQTIETPQPDLYMQSLYLSGLLYEYLQSHDDSEGNAAILYALAALERQRDNGLSLTDLSSLYLRECVNRFPSDPWAKRCFNKYRETLTLEFSGSAGVNLPPDLKADLEKMKSKIESAQKSKEQKPK